MTKCDGSPISYDAVGNPLNDGTWAYTWSQGRQLTRMTSNSSPTTYWAFAYDANGLRASRTNGSTTYKYHYDGGQLTRMMIGNTLLGFTYDASGKPVSVYYNGSYYYYALNLQGDVVAILNNSGVAVVRYTYDAWGRGFNSSGTMAGLNAIRYRSYYYDGEVGLYYLGSRYYSTKLGRFINADGYASTGRGLLGNNMYAYCLNNPVNYVDSSGKCCKWIGEKISEAIYWLEDKIIDPVKEFASDLLEDLNNFDLTNTEEEEVFSSNYISGYKETVVIKTEFDASFSFGIIGMSELQQNSTTLKHEYGHIVQLENMGLVEFTTNVAVRSITANILCRMGKLPYSYYGSTWEAGADFLGGVDRRSDNTPWPEDVDVSLWGLIELFWD